MIIKFRAWDGFGHPQKQICKVIEIDFKEQKILLKAKNNQEYWRMFSQIKLLQFTGLEDKNGKEIYEGYIVKVYSKEKDYNCEVCFGKFWFLEELENGTNIDVDTIGFYFNPLDKEVKKKYNHIGILLKTNTIEVIGNKFENPELLK